MNNYHSTFPSCSGQWWVQWGTTPLPPTCCCGRGKHRRQSCSGWGWGRWGSPSQPFPAGHSGNTGVGGSPAPHSAHSTHPAQRPGQGWTNPGEAQRGTFSYGTLKWQPWDSREGSDIWHPPSLLSGLTKHMKLESSIHHDITGLVYFWCSCNCTFWGCCFLLLIFINFFINLMGKNA